MLLELVALTLAGVHFGTPLLYYLYLKSRCLNKPWNVKVDEGYRPRVTVIVPTYNEAKLIEKKLDDLRQQNYPRSKLEIIVVDSASTDGTPRLVKRWTERHRDIELKLIVEEVRRGKAYALNTALKHAAGDIVVITDADSLWPDRETLRRVVRWFSDQRVGAVSCLKKPVGSRVKSIEDSYRKYYNSLRVAESKVWSTPIFHGELAAFRRKLLERLGGFSTDVGADDSYTATKIILMGYRAIIPEYVKCVEILPKKGYNLWRIRRAQHLIQHFSRILMSRPKVPKNFKTILYIETFLHLINPWIFLMAVIMILISALMGSHITLTLLIIGIMLLICKSFRTWIMAQMYLIIATIRNLWTKEIIWRKQIK